MALTGRMLVMQLTISLIVAAIAAAADQALPPQALPGCPDRCGDFTIRYPFGLGEGCYLQESFNITCNESAQPPTALWGSIIATNISLAEGELQVLSYIAYDCYDKQGNLTVRNNYNNPQLWLRPPFTISSTRNTFTAVGCDTIAIIDGYRPYPSDEDQYLTGCMSICNNLDSVDSCSSGIGCCQTAIPSGLKNTTITLVSTYNHSRILDFNPCSYAFIVEQDKFTFSPNTSFQQLSKIQRFPMILNWEIQDGGCAEAQNGPNFACKANSKCVDRTIDIQTEPSGYYCQCLPGFEGNPYLPDGCQDIDECMASINPCNNGTCKNSPGDYSCVCKKGFRNEGPKSCIQNTPLSKNRSLKISLGISISFFILLVGIFWIYCGMKRRKFNRLKKKYFEENGGTKLQQKLRSCTEATAKIFTEEELKKATNNYHADEILGEGGYGTVYKGTLPNKKVVAIKKSKINATSQSDQFVNEVIVLSQINHRNVVKLLGCCLETEMPLLVYEFVSNGTLSDHIHKRNGKGPLSLALRLKIAAETAESLSYLHYSTSMQILHRDVKATNILLDEKFTAKVSDFGASKLVPEDEDQLSTLVQGTMGYLDPEYLQSNTLTEKSDVYSFGVVLVELLTSRRALSFDRPEAERSLANVFVCALEDGLLKHILDEEVVKDGHFETIENVADLAKRCLNMKGSERPTMREVARELEALQILPHHSGGGKPDSSPKETDYLLASPSNAYIVDVRGEGETEGDGGSITTSIEYDQSMKNHAQLLKPYDGGR